MPADLHGAAYPEREPTPEDDDEELAGGLISFVNLENLVKHIIKKFRVLEQNHGSMEDHIKSLRRDVSTRASAHRLEEITTELGTRVDVVKSLSANQKESINSLETQLERSRVACSSLEKKLEASIKEKAVQDRLIRECQEALHDKVSVAELNMYEAKLAGYTTKLELQEVQNTLSQCVRNDTADSIADNVRLLATQFDDYTRTTRLGQQLQELRDWVNDELLNYARLKQTTDRMDELQARINDQSLAFERVHSAADSRLGALSDRVTSIYMELQNDVHRALAHAMDIQQVKDSLKRFAIRAETDAFQQDCEPKLHFCVNRIKAFEDRLRAQDDAIARVDEILLDKAAKHDITVVNTLIEECIRKEDATAEFQKVSAEVLRVSGDFEAYKADEARRMEEWRPPDYGPQIQELKARTELKADRADLVEMYQLKANRVDADELAKLQDTIHRQLEYLAVTTFGLSKLTLADPKAGEQKTVRAQNKAQVLMQSEALWNWILHNEAPANLDTLRPPPGKEKKEAEADLERRRADGAKRSQLEMRLGIQKVAT